MAHDHDHVNSHGAADDFEYEDIDIKEALGLPDALPPIRLLPLPELAAEARRAPLPAQLAALAEWVGKDGREVDSSGDLTPEDQAEVVAALGVKAVLAESFERIHRSNLIGMGVLPLQFKPGENAESLGLTGQEVFDVEGIEQLNEGTVPNEVTVTADGKRFTATVRIDTPGEADYYRHGGIMQYVLRSLLAAQ